MDKHGLLTGTVLALTMLATGISAAGETGNSTKPVNPERKNELNVDRIQKGLGLTIQMIEKALEIEKENGGLPKDVFKFEVEKILEERNDPFFKDYDIDKSVEEISKYYDQMKRPGLQMLLDHAKKRYKEPEILKQKMQQQLEIKDRVSYLNKRVALELGRKGRA